MAAKLINRLDQAQMFKLYEALRGFQAEADRDRLTAGDAAERLSKRLGFVVSVHSVLGAAKLLGVKLHIPRSTPMHHMKCRLDQLEATNKALADRVAFLETQLGVQAGSSLKVV